MKYRIVKYDDKEFGVRKKVLFWWVDETIEYDDMAFNLTFPTIEEAESYIKRIKSFYTNNKLKIVKEL